MASLTTLMSSHLQVFGNNHRLWEITKVIPTCSNFLICYFNFFFFVVARLATAAARVHGTPTIPVAQPVEKTNSNARIINPSITAKNVEQQQQLQQGAVAPSPAAASTAGPVPYPVMLGSDPGVIIFLTNFYLLPVLNASYLSDQSTSVVASYGMEWISCSWWQALLL